MREIQSLDEALNYARHALRVKKRGEHHGERGPIAYWVLWRKELAVLCFKRDMLHSFDRLYPQWGGQGWGQTMNLNLLKEASVRNAIILIVMPNGVIYGKNSSQWLYQAQKHNSIRKPRLETELEASIPVRLLKRIYPKE